MVTIDPTSPPQIDLASGPGLAGGEWLVVLLITGLFLRLVFVLGRRAGSQAGPAPLPDASSTAEPAPASIDSGSHLALLDELSTAALLVDEEGRILAVSRALEQLLGCPADSLGGAKASAVLRLDWIDGRGQILADGWDRVLAGTCLDEASMHCIHRDAERGTQTLRAACVHRPEGAWILLQKSAGWTEGLRSELNASLQHESLRLLIQDFAAELEHCFQLQRHRLAVTSEAGRLSVADNGELLSGIRLAERAVADLVSFTRDDATTAAVPPPEDPSDLIRQILDELELTTPVPLDFEPCPDLPALDADAERVALALKCLLTTAKHLAAPQDRLQVVASRAPVASSRTPEGRSETGSTGEHLRIEIHGATRTLGHEAVSGLFRPSTDVRGHQLGLGFAAVRELLRRQRGSLAVSSSPGKGTSISLTVPSRSRSLRAAGGETLVPRRHVLSDMSSNGTKTILPTSGDAGADRPASPQAGEGPFSAEDQVSAEDRVSAEDQGTADEAGRPRAATAKGPRTRNEKTRVLVMDDEQSILALLNAALRRLGFECRTTRHGEEAIEVAREALDEGRPFALAIIDLTIPGGMGGVEAAAGLGELAPEMVLVASSGYAQNPALVEFHRFGFHDVLVKPYRIPDLAELLNKHLPPA